MKKYILGLLTGIIIVGSISVVAYQMNATQITYEPKDSSWNVNNVKSAIDDIKKNGVMKAVCKLKSGEALTIGSKYECNPNGDGTTKYNFYVLRVDTDTVKLIMERNITDTVGSARTMDWQSAMNFFRNGAGKNLGWKTQVELPKAQDIADAVGNTGWDLQDKDYNGWFCLATKTQDHSGSPYCDNQSAKNYLYDYTRECSSWGCSNSLDSNYAYGYWMSDIISKQLDTTSRAWRVIMRGSLYRDVITSTANNGVRPIITINKNQIL